jgi:hypothetical protein
MSKNEMLDNSPNLIDNKLEYFSFFPIRLICYVIAFAGLYLVVFGNILGIIIGLIFFLIFFPFAIAQKRITVDLTGNKYREYLFFLGIKVGKWHSFKGFNIITITHSDKVQSMNAVAGGAQAYSNSTEFYLNLKKDNFNKLNIASGNYNSMLKKAVKIAQLYKLGIMDCSEKPIKKYTYEEVLEKFSK